MRKQKAKLISKGEGELQNKLRGGAFATQPASNVSMMIHSHFNMDAGFGMDPGSISICKE